MKGRLLEISADALVLLIDGQMHRLSADNVSEISRRQHDFLLDGVVKGASWGGAIAAGGLVAAYFSNNEPHGCPCGSVLAATMGVGAVIGFALDAAVSDTIVIYQAISASQGRGDPRHKADRRQRLKTSSGEASEMAETEADCAARPAPLKTVDC